MIIYQCDFCGKKVSKPTEMSQQADHIYTVSVLNSKIVAPNKHICGACMETKQLDFLKISSERIKEGK